MEHRATSFGSMYTCKNPDGAIIWEELYFEREGRGHLHKTWENCYVLEGSCWIMVGEEKVFVEQGQWCHIPPMTNHWMIPQKKVPFKIIITYSQSPDNTNPRN